MEKLFLLNFGDEMVYELVRSLYINVAKVYDLMLTLVEKTSRYNFDDFVQSIYVIAGVFMLFRVAIGMISMIVNPDQLNDKNTGASKMITRIIVSVVMLLVFNPNGFLMKNETGLLDRVELAIIGEDGLLSNFTVEKTSNKKTTNLDEEYLFNDNSNLLYENVNAAASKKTCYFYSPVTSSNSNPIKKYYKITFYSEGHPNAKGVVINKGGITAYAHVETDDGYKFIDPGINQVISDKSHSVQNCENWSVSMPSGSTANNCSVALGTCTATNKVYVYHNKNLSFKGYNSFSDMKKALEQNIEDNLSDYSDACSDNMNSNESVCNNNIRESLKDKNSLLPSVDKEAVEFATNTLSAFQTCESNEDNSCEEAKQNQFGLNNAKPEEAKNNIIDLMDKNKLSLDPILSIVAGLGLIIFIIVLCVDVVVRNFKLLLLEMIAPIPIISYSDPKDKIFMNWIKMFFSVYVDLFIKLFSIKIVLILIKQISLNMKFLQGIEYFFVIIGILIFAKIVPSMISKIFGLELGSSFKDIGNMLKAGAGFAAGAAIGGAAGLVTGATAFNATKGQGFFQRTLAGAQALGSTANATLRGAGAGSKGNIFGGAKDVAKINAARRDNYNTGIRPTDLLAAATLGKVGMDYASRTDRAMAVKKDDMDTLNKYTGFKGEVEDAAEGSKFMKTLRQNVASGIGENFTEKKMQEFRDTWSEYQIARSNVANKVADQIKEYRTEQDSLLASGAISQDTYNANMSAKANQLTAQIMESDYGNLMAEVRNVQQKTGIEIEVEGGKQAAIVSTMNKANTLLAQNTTVSKTAGVSEVKTFKELADTNTNVKKAATKLDEEIYAATTADTAYNVSKASNSSSSSGNK